MFMTYEIVIKIDFSKLLSIIKKQLDYKLKHLIL
jgi:hypothetical protein